MENLEKDDQIDLDSQEIPPNEEKLTDSHTENPETNAHKEDL